MGFKSFLLLIIIVFLAIFSIQNLQSISLVFFGFKSLTLPLSFWIILSLLAGIISSLFVQFLSTKPRQKTNYNQSFSPPPPPSNYPPSPAVQEKITPPRNNQRYTSSAQVTNQQYSEYDFDFLAEPQTSIDRDRQREYNIQEPSREKPATKFSPEEQDRSFISDEQINGEETENTPKKSSVEESAKSPVAEAPSEAWLKAREASLYSYQPREKTEIKIPKRIEKTETNQRSNDSSYSRRADGIYDAPYRVIPPSSEPMYEDNDDIYYDDEDDDWDF